MKANAKYTVAEIVTEAGFKPEDVVGKVRVRVGGIPVNDPAKIISVQKGATELNIIVGQEAKVVKLNGENEDTVVSEEAHKAYEAVGAEKVKAFEANKAEKEKARTEAEENPSEPKDE